MGSATLVLGAALPIHNCSQIGLLLAGGLFLGQFLAHLLLCWALSEVSKRLSACLWTSAGRLKVRRAPVGANRQPDLLVTHLLDRPFLVMNWNLS